MQDSRKNNVVELSQYGHSRGSAAQDGASLLNECGEMAAVQTGAALARTLESAAGELLDMADRSAAGESRRLCEDAMNFARERRGDFETEFRRRFYQQFKRQCRRGGGGIGSGGLDASQLSLVEPDELEGSLAASTIENALNNACGEELFGLAKRVGVLLDDPELEAGANPVGPETIGTVVMDTLKAQGLPLKAQLVLVPLINRLLPGHVRRVYQNLNQHLVDRGILPSIRVGGRKSAAPTAAAAAEAGQAAAPGQDLLSALRELMAVGGVPGASAAPPPAVAVPARPTAGMSGLLAGEAAAGTLDAAFPAHALPAAVMQSLNGLQRGQRDSLVAAGLDAGALASGQVNVVREIRNSPAMGALGQVDAMTLDIVAMVFDYILDDRRIPDAMKALIGRLQIPVLKVAMMDRSFFSQKAHPARRLLDVLAEASMGWNEEEGHESGLYRKVDELVQRVLNQFDEQVDVFAAVLDDFVRFQEDEKHRIDALTGQSAQLLRQKEQGEIARIVAHNEVESHLFDRPAPEFIRAFLLGHWEPVIGHYCARFGEGSGAWGEVIATMDDLIWSVTPKQTPEERKKLVAMLPGLIKRLDKGLADIATPAQTRDQFFTGLVKCHAVAVRAGLRSASTAPPAPDPIPVPAVVPGPGPELASAGFVEIPVLTEVVEVDPALMREIATEPEERHVEEEIVISDVGWLSRPSAASERDEHEAQVRQLKRGAWIEYRLPDGSMARAKLAWISPLRGLYLFTNRLGQRAMSINAQGLAAKFRAGEAQILDSVPLMERAVNSLLERLQQQVA